MIKGNYPGDFVAISCSLFRADKQANVGLHELYQCGVNTGVIKPCKAASFQPGILTCSLESWFMTERFLSEIQP